MNKIKYFLFFIYSSNLFSYRGGGYSGGGGGGGYSGGYSSGYFSERLNSHGGLNETASDGSILLGSIVGIILFLTIFLTWYFIHKNNKKSKDSLKEVMDKTTDAVWNIDYYDQWI